MTRSTAGVTFASSCEWLGHVHRSSGYRGRALVVPQALAFTSDRDFKVATGVDELAHVSQQKRHTVIAQLRQLEVDGWVDRAGRRRGRGAGRGGATTLLELTLPSLIRRSQVPPGTFGTLSQVSGGALGSGTNVPLETFGSTSRVPAEALGSPPHPPGRERDGEGVPSLPKPTPRPTPAPLSAELLEEAEAVLSRMPLRLQPHGPTGRQKMLGILAGLLGTWTADDIVLIACTDLPAERIGRPWGFVRARFDDRPAPKSRATTAPRTAGLVCAIHPYEQLPCRGCAADEKAAM